MLRTLRNERGIALVLVLLVALAVTVLALGGILIASSGTLTSRFHSREAALHAAVNGGIELARDSANRRGSTPLPDTGFVTLQAAGLVLDAFGTPLPRIVRSVYVGRTGGRTGGSATGGQYGSSYASALSVISDVRGAVAARRVLLQEESWARFAYAMNRWSNSSVTFACGEVAAGPVHSNANIYINCSGSPKTLFLGPVSAVGTINGKGGATFSAGYTEGATPIVWPSASDLARLQTLATDGGSDYDLTGGPATSRYPTIRLEFLTIDANGNGTIDWDEGFVRVFEAASTADTALAYVTAKRWPVMPPGTPGGWAVNDPNLISQNCGAIAQLNGTGPFRFRTASEVYNGTTGTSANKRTAVQVLLGSGSRRCHLGGAPELFQASTGDTLTPSSAVTAPYGQWRTRSTPAQAGLSTVRPGDQEYLIPLQGNPDFKGVIYVTGNVAVSGRLRGRVSVVATGNILLADDLLYTVVPGTECTEAGDALGLITPEFIYIQDNSVQTPFRIGGTPTGLFDDTPDAEIYHAFMFTLKQFQGDSLSYNPGASIAGERCPGTPQAKSGCVRVSGGIIQEDVLGATFSTGGHGWAEQHTYDQCGLTTPPPYFPTTGRYLLNRYYELDPVWLNQMGVAQYFRSLQAN